MDIPGEVDQREFLDAKAADEKFRTVPVLLLTAHQHPPVHLKHVVGLFHKPDDVGRMIDALDGDLHKKADVAASRASATNRAGEP